MDQIWDGSSQQVRFDGLLSVILAINPSPVQTWACSAVHEKGREAERERDGDTVVWCPQGARASQRNESLLHQQACRGL